MSGRAQDGVLLIGAGLAVLVLWVRGYLTAWIDLAAAGVAQAPAKQPFAFPGQSGGYTYHHQ